MDMTVGAVEQTAAMRTSSTLALAHTSVLRAKETATARASASSSSSPQSNQITSTDFMKLLVTEMQNQDPTTPTDPNAYIQQLVGVNSLQQLISINQALTPPTTPSK